MDFLIIGAGLSGAVVAHQLAKQGKKVVILERKNHIGGHAHDEWIKGILVHKYGPHIFHTDSEKVHNFMQQFWTLNNFKNEVACQINDIQVPLPFNFLGIDTFFPSEKEQLKQLLLSKYPLNSRVTILELLTFDHFLIKKLVNFIYENIFKNYTTKMWGKNPEEIDPMVLKRVPVIIGYGTRYFANKYEGIPQGGYSLAISKMLNHSNIDLRLNHCSTKVIKILSNRIYFENQKISCPIIFTGPIDELFNYQHGVLEYRSLNIVFQEINRKIYQNNAVINYPSHPTKTRITEYKHFHKNFNDNLTIISHEYPGQFDLNQPDFSTPYYPMMSESAKSAYLKYQNLANKIFNLHLLGRLATFKYLNMDQAIDCALQMAEKLIVDHNSTIFKQQANQTNIEDLYE